MVNLMSYKPYKPGNIYFVMYTGYWFGSKCLLFSVGDKVMLIEPLLEPRDIAASQSSLHQASDRWSQGGTQAVQLT